VARDLLKRSRPSERFQLALQRMAGGHRVQVLFDGAAAYPAMLEAIAQARETIELETYFWASDANGRRFLDAVCIKAQEGVKVRAVIDGAGSYWFSNDDIDRLRSAGVQLSIFHPVGPWHRRWGWQVRDHRKLLVVDSKVAFAGGLNLGDDYAPEAWGGRGWHDVHARVEGPVVEELRRLFEMSWRYAEPETWTPPAGFLRAERRRRLQQPVEQAAIETSGSRVHALAVGRWLGRRAIQRHLRHAMAAAHERIWIEAAYFVPNRQLRRAMLQAAARGVDVRVIVPRHSDVPGLRDASQFTWTVLLAAGIRIFEWLPSMLHAKTIVIDGRWCSIGSYNLDQRSLVYNWELALSIFDPEVAGILERSFGEDLARCDEVDAAGWLARSPWARLKQRFFYIFRLWL
jgi:cardiolipin synthase